MRRNLVELRQRLRTRIGSAIDQVEPGRLDEVLDDAHKLICKTFGLYESSWSASAVADSKLYAPPRGLVKLIDVEFNDHMLEYTPVSDVYKLGEQLNNIETPTWTEDI